MCPIDVLWMCRSVGEALRRAEAWGSELSKANRFAVDVVVRDVRVTRSFEASGGENYVILRAESTVCCFE